MKIYLNLWKYLTEFFLEWEMFQTKVVEKIKTHFMLKQFFPKVVLFMGHVEKCCRAREATDDNII